MSANQNILIPDGDSTWALSVMQCLSQAEGYNIFVLSSTKRTATKSSIGTNANYKPIMGMKESRED